MKKQVVNHYKVPAIDAKADVLGFALALYATVRTASARHNARVIWPAVWSVARRHRSAA